ncbi:MAG TPA: hypothetical protein VML55_10595 [Planctomycetaceae bacterium]|nr:hypothetical protein [Planctomycetaceae bacterium]
MRFVLLGDDRAVLPLARAIARHPGHALARASLVGELQGELMQIAPALRLTSAWDELLAGDVADAAIIAGAGDELLLAARQLAQSGTSLVVFPGVRQGAEFVDELTLIRDDSQIRLVPVFPRRFDPEISRLADSLRTDASGKLLHVAMERERPPAEVPGPVPLLTAAEIDADLLHDADLLRSLAGNYSQVTAFRSGRTAAGVTSATVSLAGDALPEASWSLKAAQQTHWRIAVTSERGTLNLESGEAGRGAPLAGAGVPASDPAAAADAARPETSEQLDETGARMLEHVEAGLSGRDVSPDWTDVARAFEIVEAGHRSIARRRTIDLHFETTSERSLFKTQMTALGCGLLSITLFGVIALLLLGAVFRGGRDEQELRRLLDAGWTPEAIAADPDRLPGCNVGQIRELIARVERADTVMRIARVVVFLPLFVFLVLQLLVFVARPSRHPAHLKRGRSSNGTAA